nr:hypothetical protein [bacterium]
MTNLPDDRVPTGGLHEQYFNAGVAIAMKELSQDGTLRFLPDRVGMLEGGLRSDVLALATGLAPVAVEGEYGVTPGPDADALRKLGRKVKDCDDPIKSAVAVAYPLQGRAWADPEEVAERLLAGQELNYAVWSLPDETRWPAGGWVAGDVRSLRELVVSLMQPQHVISRLAEEVGEVVRSFADSAASHLPGGHREDIAAAVGRPTGLDSLRVVGVVWFNALLFQDRIAAPHDLPLRHAAYSGGSVNPRKVLAAWNDIRHVNYLSVYDPAVSALDLFLQAVPFEQAAALITHLADAADRVATASTELFDIGAELFQWVITDRDDAASYYTRPEIAEFLARLVRPEDLMGSTNAPPLPCLVGPVCDAWG